MNELPSDNWISDQEKAKLLVPAWQRLVNLMAELCETPGGFIVQAKNEKYRIIVSSESDENPYGAGATIDEDVNIFCREVVKQNKALYVSNATERPEWQSNPEVTEDGFNSYLGYPLHWPNGETFGTICVMDFAKTNYDDRYYRLIEHFRDMAERELELLSKNIQLEGYALNDDLTSLLNRKGFLIASEQVLKFAKRSGKFIGVLYFDLDNLKAINDNHGHQMGDKAISKFAEHLKTSFREVDVIARFGGDEFVVLFHEATPKDTQVMIQRLFELVKQEKSHPEISFSYGYASSASNEVDAEKIEQLLKRADDQMYINKRAKKN